jgi:hypothetical protein
MVLIFRSPDQILQVAKMSLAAPRHIAKFYIQFDSFHSPESNGMHIASIELMQRLVMVVTVRGLLAGRKLKIIKIIFFDSY